MKCVLNGVVVLGLVVFTAGAWGSTTVTFDELTKYDYTGATGSYWNGADGSGGFTSQGATLGNTYTDWGGGFYSWSGFAYSNVNDTTTAGYTNQYAAYTGTDFGGHGNYAVGYLFSSNAVPTITFSTPLVVESVQVTNTTYAALEMLYGSSYSKKFGGTSGNDPDWFLLTITGKDADGDVTGAVTCYLANYRYLNNSRDYILDTWEDLDLSGLGEVSSLEFTLSSSDNSAHGMNTPAYFVIDNLVIPEPATISMLLLGLLGLVRRSK
jgi:hypothetical protein